MLMAQDFWRKFSGTRRLRRKPAIWSRLYARMR